MKLTADEMEIFELAHFLRMPVYKLMNEMPYDEFLGWYDYFARKPYQWRDDNRASLIMSAMGAKASPKDVFPSLGVLYANKQKEDNPVKTLKGSFLFNKMLNATGGDSLDILGSL